MGDRRGWLLGLAAAGLAAASAAAAPRGLAELERAPPGPMVLDFGAELAWRGVEPWPQVGWSAVFEVVPTSAFAAELLDTLPSEEAFWRLLGVQPCYYYMRPIEIAATVPIILVHVNRPGQTFVGMVDGSRCAAVIAGPQSSPQERPLVYKSDEAKRTHEELLRQLEESRDFMRRIWLD